MKERRFENFKLLNRYITGYYHPKVQAITYSSERLIKAKRDSILITFVYISFLIVTQVLRIIYSELSESMFITNNIVFTFFVGINIYSLKGKKRWLLNPLFLASLKMFLLAYGLTIFYIYAEGKPITEYLEVKNPFDYLNNGMIFASIGFISMWYSYHSNFVKRIAFAIFNLITLQKKLLHADFTPNWFLVIAFFIISIVFKLILISFGVYGVIGTISPSEFEIPYLQYIITLSSISSIAVLFVSIYFFKTNKNKLLFLTIFLIDLFFSIISGFKGAIVMSFVVLGISYYVAHGKIKYLYLLIAISSIGFAYAIIEPYRQYIQKNINTDKNSLSGITESFIKSYRGVDVKKQESDNYEIFRRLNFLPELVKFQNYKNEHGLTEDDPDFIYITLTTPLQIFTPRFLWKDKPKSDLGVWWVTQRVFGMNEVNSSSAFGPIGFLYLTGGTFAIIIGFIIIGFILQLTYLFLNSRYWGGIFIALALLSRAIELEAGFNFYIIGFVHILIFSIIFQYFVLKTHTKIKYK